MANIKTDEYTTKDEMIKLISDLVKIPSYPDIPNQETATAECFMQFFEKEGINAETVLVDNGRKNIIATLKGTGNGNTLLLTGHLDTVPPYDMKDALTPLIKDNLLYGRGAVDMKGPLACMAIAMAVIKRAGIQHSGDIIFAGVTDEEQGSRGTIALIESGIKADAAIIGEPTNLKLCVAHRGLEWIEFHFIGKTVHGGKQSEGINAIDMACKFITELNKTLPAIISGTEHPVIGNGSFNLGTISGGTQPSTVAGYCIVTLDRRWLPGEKYPEIMQQFQNIIDNLSSQIKDFKCQMKIMDDSIMKEGYVHEAMEIPSEHKLVKIIEAETEIATGKKAELSFFPAWSDGGIISGYAGIPSLVFAPGDVTSAHSANENINLEEAWKSIEIYTNTITQYCE